MITILLQKILDLLKAKLGLINTTPETASGASVSFETDKELPLDSLTVEITAQQAGEGTPAPDNVREISGFSSVVVTQKNGSDETVDTITVALGKTYYGGTLDVINGTATITWVGIDLSQAEYTTTAWGGYKITIENCKPFNNASVANCMSSIYATTSYNDLNNNKPNNSIAIASTGNVYIVSDNTPSGQFVYQLATPITLTGLTNDNFMTIEGVNVISANSGNVSVGYRISNEMAAANKDISSYITVNTTDFSSVSYKVIRAGNVVMISLYSATVVNSYPEALFSGLPKGYNNANIMFLDTVSGDVVQGVMSSTGYLSASNAQADQRISAIITYITKDEV